MNSGPNFVAETNFLSPLLSPLLSYYARRFVFTFSRDTKLRTKLRICLKIWSRRESSEDDDRRFFRSPREFSSGEGETPKREKIEWKFIVGQPMLMLRARGKIEIRLHFRESWRVGGSTARTGLLVREKEGEAAFVYTKCPRNFKESRMPGVAAISSINRS